MAKTDSAGQRATDAVVGGDSTVADLKSEWQKYKNARQVFEPDWFLNSAFFVGQQWLYWNHGRLDRPRLAKYRETIVDNRILPIITARVAKKVKSRPTFVATPFTGQESDVDAAKITEKVMAFDWEYLDLQQKLYQAQLFADIAGAGFWKIYWDSTEGDSVECVCGPDGEIMKQANGTPVKADMFPDGLPEGLSTKTIAQGDVCVDVVSPFHFYPEPLAESMDDLEKCFEEKIRSPDYIKQRYGVELEADTEAPIGPVESRIFGSVLMPAQGVGYKGIRVFEFWAKPCPSYPKGKRVVWAQDQLLTEEDNPIDPLPYVMFSGVKVPNRFWPTSVTTQLRGPQIALNKIESQIQENANRIGNPALLKSRQANVSYTGVPGEEVLYDSTVSDAVPQYLTPPNMPQYVERRGEEIISSMNEISGLHASAGSRAPAPTSSR